MPRLFTGIEIGADMRALLGGLKSPLPGASWVDSRNLHITLRFAGDVDNPTAREFADQLSMIDVPCFSIRLEGLGVFGKIDPHTIWAGVEAGPELERLARANERAARLAGLKPETRAFHPHVTLARLKHTRDEAVARLLGRHAAFRSPEILVSRFVLYSSKPSIGGGPYVAEETFLLAGGGYDEDSGNGYGLW